MNSLLIITALDCEQEANQRIHHVIRHIGARFQKVTIMHFAQYNRKSLTNWVKEGFSFSIREYWSDNTHHLRINPIGNIPYAFGKGLLHFPDTNAHIGIFRKLLMRALNFLLIGFFTFFSTLR